jgi:hypothetical protein
MGRALISAAAHSPISVVDDQGRDHTVIPGVTLRLSRLKPTQDDQFDDPRVGQTIDMLREMGLDIALGEREDAELSLIPSYLQPQDCSNSQPSPSKHINLDLSALIALVSDLTHSPLPDSFDEANTRYSQPKPERTLKRDFILDSAEAVLEPIEDKNMAQHCRAITQQLLQEMGKGLMQEICDQLSRVTSEMSSVQLWTTPG